MTVKELIDSLMDFDQDTEVMIHSYESSTDTWYKYSPDVLCADIEDGKHVIVLS